MVGIDHISDADLRRNTELFRLDEASRRIKKLMATADPAQAERYRQKLEDHKRCVLGIMAKMRL